jgi:RND family efflux transporter MFP subunit
VSGQVVATSPALLPGGTLHEGDLLLRIDPRDYELAVRQRESDVARARQALRLEEGQQDVALREYELLGEVLEEDDAELVLRQPQLEAARTAYDAALASLEKARLDLERTRVTAPFNAVVQEKLVDLGAVVSASTALATLVGTDACWVEVLVPEADLAWIDLPADGGGSGSPARVRQDAVWDEGVWREGRVLCRLGSLESQGRMARLLVEVDDPYALRPENAGAPPLLMDAYVSTRILGRTVADVVAVSRSHVHDGDKVWLMDGEGLLRIHTLDPVYAGEDVLLVADGLEAGQRLVVSEIATPVEGMPLRLEGEPTAPAPAGTGGVASR